MSVLKKAEIKGLINNNPPLLESFISLQDQLQTNGFDLTIRDIARPAGQGVIAVENSQRYIPNLEPLSFDASGFINLDPGPYVITLNEIINLPKDIMALGKTRSSLLRCGVAIHNAVWDAGYHGRSQALMVVYNNSGFKLQKDARVFQLVFLKLSSATDGYSGVYQNENV